MVSISTRINHTLFFKEFVELEKFTFRGKEYQVDKVTELESEAGSRCIQVITKDNRKFKLSFNESIFKWVVTEATE